MENLLNNKKSLMISSLNQYNVPEVSYAPFVMIDDKIYVYLSKAANHYYNLSDNKNCSVMIIEDESECKTIFARQRVSFECEAKMLIDVEDKVFDMFDETHGASMMSVLKSMDFNVFELKIIKGRLVKGFGKAYDVEFNNGKYELIHVVEVQHNRK